MQRHSAIRTAARAIFTLLAALACVLATPALAQVRVSFHSFNGSVLFGRYPHTFVVFEGTLEATGEAVNENFGFASQKVSRAILRGPVKHMVISEEQKYVTSTNRHFTIPVSDAKYRAMREEIERWRNAPGKFYDLKTRNCIHFVGKMALMLGLKVEYPKKYLRKPKAWLNLVTKLNPQLGAEVID